VFSRAGRWWNVARLGGLAICIPAVKVEQRWWVLADGSGVVGSSRVEGARKAGRRQAGQTYKPKDLGKKWGRGVTGVWNTSAVFSNKERIRKINAVANPVHVSLYADLNPHRQALRYWKRMWFQDYRSMYFLTPRCFAELEYCREQMQLEDHQPLSLRVVPYEIQFEAQIAVEEGWEPDWWEKKNVKCMYRIIRERRSGVLPLKFGSYTTCISQSLLKQE